MGPTSPYMSLSSPSKRHCAIQIRPPLAGSCCRSRLDGLARASAAPHALGSPRRYAAWPTEAAPPRTPTEPALQPCQICLSPTSPRTREPPHRPRSSSPFLQPWLPVPLRQGLNHGVRSAREEVGSGGHITEREREGVLRMLRERARERPP